MKQLNLQATTQPQKVVKEYLEQNASDVLADKINNGVAIEKDGKTLTNKKTLDGFMDYANSQAREMAEQGARYACVSDDVVFGWAIHYFEEDSIEEKLYNEDGTEYVVKAKITKATPKKTDNKKVEQKSEQKPEQLLEQKNGQLQMPIVSNNDTHLKLIKPIKKNIKVAENQLSFVDLYSL